MLWALFPQAVFIPKQKSVHALVTFHSRILHSEVNALIDSGATESFISPDLVHHFTIPIRVISRPRTIRNVDSTENKLGKVELAADLDIHYNGNKMTHMFYVLHLGKDHMLLGMPFLAATNPNMNWTNGTFKGKVIASSMDAYKWIPNKDSKVYKPFKIIPGYAHFECPREGDSHMLNITPEDYTSHIDPSTFIFLCRITKATALAAQNADRSEYPWQEVVTLEYYKYGKVFSERKAQRFPRRRPWDHAINLVSDTPRILVCKTYPLTEGQQEQLDKFLREHLRKGYICVSNSPYASPFFFIKKKDGKLQCRAGKSVPRGKPTKTSQGLAASSGGCEALLWAAQVSAVF